jgi:hypothetical protein
MLALLPNSPAVIPPYLMDPARIGFLITPSNSRRTYRDVLAGYSWAVDNEMYAVWKSGREFDMPRYLRFVASLHNYGGRCLFVVVPDLPGDHAGTLALYQKWVGELRAFGKPLAFAAQNGLTNIPADLDYDVLFIGGTNEYRRSGDLYPVVQQARAAGKWVHFGRCNTRRGIETATRLGCDSFDGTKSAIDMKELPKVMAWQHAMGAQMSMGFAS